MCTPSAGTIVCTGLPSPRSATAFSALNLWDFCCVGACAAVPVAAMARFLPVVWAAAVRFAVATDGFACPAAWQKVTAASGEQSCIQFFPSPLSFGDAQAFCAGSHPLASLVTSPQVSQDSSPGPCHWQCSGSFELPLALRPSFSAPPPPYIHCDKLPCCRLTCPLQACSGGPRLSPPVKLAHLPCFGLALSSGALPSGPCLFTWNKPKRWFRGGFPFCRVNGLNGDDSTSLQASPELPK